MSLKNKTITSLLLVFTFVFQTTYGNAAAPRLLIKIATREREEKFFSALDQYYNKLSHKIPFHVVVSCDIDDTVMNSPENIERLKSYPNLTVYFGNNSSKIEACNADIEKHPDFDILLLLSDDMIPVVRGFDTIIAALMQQHFPNYDGILHFNDGFQKQNLITLPVIGKKYYDQFGYIYFPVYRSFFCDNEMTDVAKMLKKTVYVDKVIIKHLHPNYGNAETDPLYLKNQKFWDQDESLYWIRKSQNFGMKKNKSGYYTTN